MIRPDASKPLRVFFALVPDAATQKTLGILGREIAARAGGRAIVDANLHLTLAFIGDVDTAGIQLLRTIVTTLPRRAFTLDLDSVGMFRHSDLAWIAPPTMPIELIELRAALANALANVNFTLETRPFHAHITLVRRCAKKIAKAQVEMMAWRVERVAADWIWLRSNRAGAAPPHPA